MRIFARGINRVRPALTNEAREAYLDENEELNTLFQEMSDRGYTRQLRELFDEFIVLPFGNARVTERDAERQGDLRVRTEARVAELVAPVLTGQELAAYAAQHKQLGMVFLQAMVVDPEGSLARLGKVYAALPATASSPTDVEELNALNTQVRTTLATSLREQLA